MSSSHEQKMEVAAQFRTAAWRIGREAQEIGVPLPASVRMVLGASDDDFLVAQHRGPASTEIVAKEIEAMECDLDKLVIAKLGATVLRRDVRLVRVNQEHTDQSSYGAAG